MHGRGRCLAGLAAFATVLVMLPAGAGAQSWRAGTLEHDTGVDRQRTEYGTDINLEWRGDALPVMADWPTWLSGRLTPFVGYAGQLRGDTTDQVYGGLGLALLSRRCYQTTLDVGLAAHDGPLDKHDPHRLAMGRRVLFYTALETGIWLLSRHGLFVFYQHSSNGPMGGPNEGINNLGVRYGFRYR